MLISIECNQILFYIMPHHNGSHYEKQILSQFETQTLT